MYIRGGIPGIYPPVRLIVNWSSSRGTAVSLALSGSWRTFRSPGANSKTATPDRAFGASVASDAGAFADEVLVAGSVVGVDDRRDSVKGPLERVPAQALMTFSNDAVDAAVRSVSDTVNNLG